MNIKEQVRKYKKELIVAALIGTGFGLYFGSKYRIIKRSHVEDIRQLVSALIQKGYIKIIDDNTVQIIENVL